MEGPTEHIEGMNNDKKETVQEVPVQEQYVKTNEIHVDTIGFEKMVALLGSMIKPIDFTKKFKVILDYNPNNQKVELNYFKQETRRV